MKKIYLAGTLFNSAERMHLLALEHFLKSLGREVILPQREALKFAGPNGFDVPGIAEDCARTVASKDVVYVGCADGADVDSGTCVELGIAITATGRAVIYRTDFRTAEDREVGLNAMLRLKGVAYIYKPCFYTEPNEIELFYTELAQEIHDRVSEIE